MVDEKIRWQKLWAHAGPVQYDVANIMSQELAYSYPRYNNLQDNYTINLIYK